MPLVLLAPLFACALPNFAALAPTAVPQEPATIEPTAELEQTQTVVAVSSGQVTPPQPPEPISELRPAPAFPNYKIEKKIVTGRQYQLRESVVLEHDLQGGESLIYQLSAGGRLSLKNQDGSDVENVVSGGSGEFAYLLVPNATAGSVQVQIEIESLPAHQDYLLLTIENLADSESSDATLRYSGFITEETLERIEYQATAGRTFVAILKSSATLDGVFELYDSNNYILTLDDKGVGESETLIYSADETATWFFTVFGFADSFGDFEFAIFEIGG